VYRETPCDYVSCGTGDGCHVTNRFKQKRQRKALKPRSRSGKGSLRREGQLRE
jgi:hypothetical protein